jgi:geranylgeranylglycerol-phosphate geranylgeranyltransferase
MKPTELAKAVRIENCFISAIGVIAGSIIVAGGLILEYKIFLAMLSAALITGAGNLINDFYDKEVDRRLGKEKTSNKKFYKISMLFFGAGIFLAAFINKHAIFIAATVSIFLILYSSLMQKIKIIGNWVVAIGTSATLVYGAAVSQNYYPVILPAFSAIFANAAREIIKDTQDQSGDKGTKKTLPMIVKKSLLNNYILTLYSLAISLAIFLIYLGTMKNWFYIPLIGVASILFMESALKYSNQDYAFASKLSKYGMIISLIAFIVGSI